MIGDVLALAAEELSTRNVTLEGRLPDHPLMANVDADLLKQAALNVIQNGARPCRMAAPASDAGRRPQDGGAAHCR